jgi:hypothetical protein
MLVFMAKLITIENAELTHFFSKQGSPKQYCQELEEGNILFFPTRPFEFPKEELEFLLAQKQTAAANRKNIAYKPQSDKITNFVHSSVEQGKQLLEIMRNYSKRSVRFLSQLLSPYAEKWRLDYASFRPFQEKGRQLRTRARNDLLHVDSFPTRPMHGSRILRFFTNINPHESRYWTTTEPFAQLASKFGGTAGMPFPSGISDSLAAKMIRMSKKLAHQLGLPVILRSPYDVFMLHLHNFLKENEEFQKTCPKDNWEFPPGSCWAVYTDQVSHAATAGQYALEQTLIVPLSALIDPEKAPVSILEKLTGGRMVDSDGGA